MSKCVKADGSEPTEIEASVATELKNLEQGSSEIKVELRELTFLSAREVDVGGGKKAYIANYMFPEGRTCSGDKKVLEKACELATKEGAKNAKMLNVSGAFHTPYMADAQAALTKALEAADIKMPSINIFSNVTGKPYESVAEIKELLKRQVPRLGRRPRGRKGAR